MATSDGESCSAEDRALQAFEGEPWSDTDEGSGNPWGALEDSINETRKRFVARYQEAFRHGFRAGRKLPERPTLALSLQERHFANQLDELLTRVKVLEHNDALRDAAPQAQSPLGVELSKIRDRLNALEGETSGLRHNLLEVMPAQVAHARRIEALEAHPEPDYRGRFMGIEGRLEILEKRERDAFTRGHEAAEPLIGKQEE